MKWTDKWPEAVGYYWVKATNTDNPAEEIVWYTGEGFYKNGEYINIPSLNGWICMFGVKMEWSGPIEKPQEGENGVDKGSTD